MATSGSEIIEIFSAIQGEGPIVGRRQIFLRFGRCDLHCRYCDTPLCHVELERCRIEVEAGARRYDTHTNPVSDDDLIHFVTRLAGDVPHHSVSLTGGEPLLHAGTIGRIAGPLHDAGLKLYLETHGQAPQALSEIVSAIDIIGMDIKLPSSSGIPADLDANAEFLRIALKAKVEIFVKLVVDEATPDEEIDAVMALINEQAPEVPVILQPVTPFRGVGTPPDPDRILAMNARMLSAGVEALVIPQTHKMIDQK